MQAAHLVASVHDVSNTCTLNKGYRGVTPLCHRTTWDINLVKIAEHLVIIRALSKRGVSEVHIDRTIPAMPCTIHETAHYCGSTNQSLHIKWTEDDTHFACSGEGNSSSSIGLFFLSMTLFFREISKLLTTASPPVRKPILVCANTTI